MSGQVLRGIGVGTAASVGRCVRFAAPITAPADEPVPGTPEQIAAAEQLIGEALETVAANLQASSEQHAGETLGDVLAAAAEMALDPALLDRSVELLGEGNGPANAITKTIAEYAETFIAIGGYMAERVGDLNSVRDRAVAHVLGVEAPSLGEIAAGSVIVAHELTPADTSGLDLTKVVALVTEAGGPTSHTAIIARQRGLPCVVKTVGVLDVAEGAWLAVDGARGLVTVDPDDELRAAIAERTARRQLLLTDRSPGATADGHQIQLLANIGTVADAQEATAEAVEGVGLFRTEFMFLDSAEEPSIEYQADQYRQVLQAFEGRKVVIRTLDAGADKPLAYANTEPEENPALGVRAYRLVRSVPHLLTNQLKALALAVVDVPETDAWVMAPMISTTQEAADFYQQATAAGLAKVGIMVEVPAVALCAGEVLGKVDFASIGTNDLAQYTMAADRQNGALADLIDRWQPAVLRLVAQTSRAGAELGRPVGVCGESASDPLMALVLCGLGITSLSMSAASVPEVRYALRHTTLETCQKMAEAALSASDGRAALAAVTELLNAEVRDALLVE